MYIVSCIACDFYVVFTLLFLGIHPHCASNVRDDFMSTLEDLIQKPECVGMGEIGLDYNRNFSPKEKQKEVFEQQVSTFVGMLRVNNIVFKV